MSRKRWVWLAAGVIVAAVVAAVLSLVNGDEGGASPKRTPRPAAVAGQFYPASADELKAEIAKYLDAAKPPELGPIRGLVSPHAGYIYSGPVAAYGYKALEGRHYKTVIVIAPAHHVYFRGASIPNVSGYETPLGTVPLSPLADTLRATEVFTDVPKAHVLEHSIEVQLPFLQVVLGDFQLVPILVGDADAEAIAKALLEHLDDETLIVASSDLSHYLPYDQAKMVDAFTVRTIGEADADLIELCQACGKTPVAVLLRIARAKGWRPHVLDARNSGDTTGAKDQVVGYCSAAFTEEAEPFVPLARPSEPLDEAGQKKLLELARASLEAAVKGGKPPEPDVAELPEALRQPGGAFVTLTIGGRLRGCIGHILPYSPLFRTVIECAAAAALEDPRFRPVREAELATVHVEVSVLTVPKRLEASSPDEVLAKLQPGKDGVYLVVGLSAATYLPQVWEQLADKGDFMSELSLKAGLPADAWKDPAARVFIYHAQVFEEERGTPGQ